MRADIVRNKDVIFKCDVSGEGDFVSEDVVVADDAVVGDVNADHEEVARTDASGLFVTVGAMKGAKLSNHIVVADFEIAPLAFELQILRLTAQNRMFKNPIARANFRKPLDDGVGSDLAIWADFDVVFDDGCRMNGHFLTDFQDLQDFQNNHVLWILQILFMMLGCLGVFSSGGDEKPLFSDQFRRGESEKGKLSGVKGSRLISGLSDVAWKAFQSVNQRLPEGESIRPKWAPGPLLKSYERTAPPLGFPRETDSLCPTCVKEVRNA